MPRRLIVTGVKLILASLIVGLVLSLLGITPREVLEWAGVRAKDMVDLGMSMADRAWTYVILGAGIVIPVWLVIAGIRYLRGRG